MNIFKKVDFVDSHIARFSNITNLKNKLDFKKSVINKFFNKLNIEFKILGLIKILGLKIINNFKIFLFSNLVKIIINFFNDLFLTLETFFSNIYIKYFLNL